MTSHNSQNIDELFSRSETQTQLPIDERLWDRVEYDLSDTTSRKFLLRSVIGIAASFLLVASIYIAWSSQSDHYELTDLLLTDEPQFNREQVLALGTFYVGPEVIRVREKG